MDQIHFIIGFDIMTLFTPLMRKMTAIFAEIHHLSVAASPLSAYVAEFLSSMRVSTLDGWIRYICDCGLKTYIAKNTYSSL